MSQWHRENPELAGTEADPWMQHKSYRDAVLYVRSISRDYKTCRNCGAETLKLTWCGVCGEDL